MVMGRYRWTVVERVESERIKLAAGAIGMMIKPPRREIEVGYFEQPSIPSDSVIFYNKKSVSPASMCVTT